MPLRITGGLYRNLTINVPSARVRPTQDKVRLAFFSILGDSIVDANFFDLFAGSGIVGFEALSRGASYVECVDISERNCRVIKENFNRLNIKDKVDFHVTCSDVVIFLEKFCCDRAAFTIIYADPPYDENGFWQRKILSSATNHYILSQEVLLVIEQSERTEVINHENWYNFMVKKYGGTSLLFFKAR